MFSEIGIKIEQLNPITNYKEENVLSLDNLQIIEDDPKPILEPITSNPFGTTNFNVQNMNINLDPSVLNNMISKYVSEMLYNGRISGGVHRETPRPSKDIIKTET